MGALTNIKKKKEGFVKNYLSGFIRAAVIAILVFLQFVMIFVLSYYLVFYQLFVYYSVQILGVAVIIGLISTNSSPSFKIAWLTIISLLPIMGFLMYLMWGRESGSKRIRQETMRLMEHGHQFLEYRKETMQSFETCNPERVRLARYMEHEHFPLFSNNQITYYPMGEDVFEAIIEDIENAKHFVFINFFIIGEGVLWARIHELLKRKVAEGVKIMFMYDDFGAIFRTDKDFRHTLESEGIEVRIFNPIHKYMDKLYMNYRSHQKIIVVDGNIGYTGGMNLADEYVNEVDRFGVWKDNAVRICGEAVWGLSVIFLQMWGVCSEKVVDDYSPYKPTMKFEENNRFVQIISDGPANNPNNPVVSIYRQFISNADKFLYITTPYLVLENDMRDALVEAVKSGVDVRIITPAIPDKKMVKLVTEYCYGSLLREGVRIYEYTPGFIHAKTLVTDKCAIVGTINMDYRSFYLHYECGAFMWDKDIVNVITDDIMQTIEVSHEVTYEEWKARPLWTRIRQRVLVMFATLM